MHQLAPSFPRVAVVQRAWTGTYRSRPVNTRRTCRPRRTLSFTSHICVIFKRVQTEFWCFGHAECYRIGDVAQGTAAVARALELVAEMEPSPTSLRYSLPSLRSPRRYWP